jgi:peptide deformylase
MSIRDILLLGNDRLYEVSQPAVREDGENLCTLVRDLHDTLMDYRRRYGAGRAIAAPQIGVMKRVIYMNTGQPIVFINPEITHKSAEMIEIWDDCMSFPNLLVRVLRHRHCKIIYKDMEWKDRVMELNDDLSELLQHEYDHLDGILAVSRAIDGRSFALKG